GPFHFSKSGKEFVKKLIYFQLFEAYTCVLHAVESSRNEGERVENHDCWSRARRAGGRGVHAETRLSGQGSRAGPNAERSRRRHPAERQRGQGFIFTGAARCA